MAYNIGEFEVDPESGEYRQVNKPNSGGTPSDGGATGDAGGGKPPKMGRKKMRSKGGRMISSIVITLIFALVYFYLELPALNYMAMEFYVFIILICVVFSLCELLLGGFRGDSPRSYVVELRRRTKLPFYLVVACIAVMIIGSVIGMQVFRASSYASLLEVEDGDFTTEVAEISFDQIPRVDRGSANVLANRKLGELSDLVSQFEVYPDSYQINYAGGPVRVTYLEYGDFFKWLNNTSEGIPAYMIIDMVTQEVTVQRIEEGIKYSPSEYFFRDIDRHLRLQYPTKMFNDVNFEIDEEGHPYWVASVATKRIGLFAGEDITGAVLVDAVTGESVYYDTADIPTWVDRVFTSDLILQQYNFHGLYQGGFINSIFGQSGCTQTTSDFNYIAQDDDVWLYTGITSVGSDQGNIGFILVNQRTKEARYYPSAGAEESSARSSAEGAVQQFSYTATSPLLLNIGGQPTYFMSLKDASQLVKMYAMVNVQQYQIVATGTTVDECAANYERLLVENGILDGITQEPEPMGTDTVSGVVVEKLSAVVGGNTHYYFRLEYGNDYYEISAATYPTSIIISEGDEVKITYTPTEEGAIHPASEVEILG